MPDYILKSGNQVAVVKRLKRVSESVTALPFWELLSDTNKVELVQKFKLPVFFIETPFGTEIRLKGIYYGEQSLEEIDRLMRQTPDSPKRVK